MQLDDFHRAVSDRLLQRVRQILSELLHCALQVERLGDTRQQVRQDACELLLTMFNNMPAGFVMEKMSRFWNHRAWKVRHGVLQTIAEAVAADTPGILASKEQNEYIITQVVNLVEDPNECVRSNIFLLHVCINSTE